MPTSGVLSRTFHLRIDDNLLDRLARNANCLSLSKADYLRRLIAVPIGEQERDGDAAIAVDASETNPVYGEIVLCGYVIDFAAKALNAACRVRRKDGAQAAALLSEAVGHLEEAVRLLPVLRKSLDRIGQGRRVHFVGNFYLLFDRALSHWRQLYYACGSALAELAEDGAACGVADSFARAREALGEINGFRLHASAECERLYREDRAAYGDCVVGIARLEGAAR